MAENTKAETVKGGKSMDFRLIYRGLLPAESGERVEGQRIGRAKQKHLLRKEFHKQLRELWKQHPDLREQAQSKFIVTTTSPNRLGYPGPGVKRIIPVVGKAPPNAKTWVEHIADDHHLCGGRFVPLVSKLGGFTCSLEVLFLRRDNPGHLITSGGDIDNRIKVLLDGLRMPQTAAEFGGLPLDTGEDPFFCLLEDDNLITSLSVVTDRLLVPQDVNENAHDVHLIIRATVVNPSALFAGNRLV